MRQSNKKDVVTKESIVYYQSYLLMEWTYLIRRSKATTSCSCMFLCPLNQKNTEDDIQLD